MPVHGPRINHYLRGLSTDRLLRMLDLITTNPNGDTAMPRMVTEIEAELEAREITRIDAALARTSTGQGE